MDPSLVTRCFRNHSRRSASRRIVMVCFAVGMTTHAFFQKLRTGRLCLRVALDGAPDMMIGQRQQRFKVLGKSFD
jgi:hypothetical protein